MAAKPSVNRTCRLLMYTCCRYGKLNRLHKVLLKEPNRTLMQISRKFSTVKTPILGQSVLLLQDGLDINEIPVVVRRMQASEFPFTTPGIADRKIRLESQDEQNFRTRLLECVNMKEVFALLEVPSNHMTHYAATYALQHICQLVEDSRVTKKPIHDTVNSFVQQAVLHELFETATKEVNNMKSETLFQLIRCSLKCEPQCKEIHVHRLNDEIERRLGDGILTISEICTGITVFSHPKGDLEVLNNLWIHLGSRQNDINETNLSLVFNHLKYAGKKQNYLIQILEKRFKKCFLMLKPLDIAIIAKVLAFLNYQSYIIPGLISKWLCIHLHEVKDHELMDTLTLFSHFKIWDIYFFNALVRYVSAKVGQMDKTLIAMVTEYCNQHKYLSPKIIKTIMQDFTKNGENYSDRSLVMTLRVLGMLNYVPPNASQLFMKIEEELRKRAGDMDVALLADLLASFVYIERPPINFLEIVFTKDFVRRMCEIPDHHLRVKSMEKLLQLQASMKIDLHSHHFRFRRVYFSIEDGPKYLANTVSPSFVERSNDKHFITKSLWSLKTLLGDSAKHIQYKVKEPLLFYWIEAVIHVKNGKVVQNKKSSWGAESPFDHKLALVLYRNSNYCSNVSRLLGEYAMRDRHLTKLGYKIIPVKYNECKNLSNIQFKEQLKTALEEYIDRSVFKTVDNSKLDS